MPSEIHRLRAVLTPIGTLRCTLTGGRRLSAQLSIERIIQNESETYPGPYVVDPSFANQILETAQKIMSDDVTVHPIEVSRVSNLSGGTTVYIGGVI